MLPSGKFMDDKSSLILQDIREKERLVHGSNIVSIESELKGSRGNTLPPIKDPRKSDVKEIESLGKLPQSVDLISQGKKINDNLMYKEKKHLYRNLSFDSSRKDNPRYYGHHSRTSNREIHEDQKTRIENESRIKYDFDAYLQHALKEREENRLFKKDSNDDDLMGYGVEERRRARPKTAHYGKRRTSCFDTGDL